MKKMRKLRTPAEVLIIMKTMKDSKVPGHGEIQIELIQNAPGDVSEILAQFS